MAISASAPVVKTRADLVDSDHRNPGKHDVCTCRHIPRSAETDLVKNSDAGESPHRQRQAPEPTPQKIGKANGVNVPAISKRCRPVEHAEEMSACAERENYARASRRHRERPMMPRRRNNR